MNIYNSRDSLWEKLVSADEIDEIMEVNENEKKSFALKIRDNDLDYLVNNYRVITNGKTKYDLFLVALAFSNNIEIIDWIINKFMINIECPTYRDYNDFITCIFVKYMSNNTQ